MFVDLGSKRKRKSNLKLKRNIILRLIINKSYFMNLLGVWKMFVDFVKFFDIIKSH